MSYEDNDKKELTHQDLETMLKGYENTIKLNTAIYTKLEKISDLQTIMVNDYKNLSDLISKSSDKLTTQTERISSVQAVITHDVDIAKTTILESVRTTEKEIGIEMDGIKSKITAIQYLLGSIIITLIGIIITLVTK